MRSLTKNEVIIILEELSKTDEYKVDSVTLYDFEVMELCYSDLYYYLDDIFNDEDTHYDNIYDIDKVDGGYIYNGELYNDIDSLTDALIEFDIDIYTNTENELYVCFMENVSDEFFDSMFADDFDDIIESCKFNAYGGGGLEVDIYKYEDITYIKNLDGAIVYYEFK